MRTGRPLSSGPLVQSVLWQMLVSGLLDQRASVIKCYYMYMAWFSRSHFERQQKTEVKFRTLIRHVQMWRGLELFDDSQKQIMYYHWRNDSESQDNPIANDELQGLMRLTGTVSLRLAKNTDQLLIRGEWYTVRTVLFSIQPVVRRELTIRPQLNLQKSSGM